MRKLVIAAAVAAFAAGWATPGPAARPRSGRRYADLHDCRRCAAEARRSSRADLRDDPTRGAVLQSSDPDQFRRTSVIGRFRLRPLHRDAEADRWRKTYTSRSFGRQFHDGSPLTAQDVGRAGTASFSRRRGVASDAPATTAS